VVKSRVTVLKRVAELVDRAEVEVTLAIPYRLLDEVADELRAAVDRGVLVVLIVTDVDPATELELDGLASVARAWEQPMPTMLTVDQQAGIVAPGEMLSPVRQHRPARLSSSPRRALASGRHRLLPGNYLPMAAEVYTADPTGLPPRSGLPRGAGGDAAPPGQRRVRARVTGRSVSDDLDVAVLEGQVVEVRQGLLEPATNDFPVENTLFVETDEGTFSVGGQGAFVEDFRRTRSNCCPASRAWYRSGSDLATCQSNCVASCQLLSKRDRWK